MVYTVRFATLLAIVSAVFAAPAPQFDSGGSTGVNGASSNDGSCTSLELVFARGTTESQSSLGVVGGPLYNSLKQQVSDASAYNVVYSSDAEYFTSPGQGATDAANHINLQASKCPNQMFAVAGYSKGGFVVHELSVSSAIRSRIVAAVVFGDPERTYPALKWPVPNPSTDVKSFCNLGDPVCESGADFTAHLQYAANGDTTQGAQFIAQRFQASN